MQSEAPDQWEARLEDYLKAQGLRMTRQRLTIAETFFAVSGHPNIDDLYAEIRSRDPRIGQATVYRTLKLLVDCGLADQSRFGDGTTRYEPAGGDHHDHIICTRCGRIVEFHNEIIERLQEEIAVDHGFEMVDHEMVIHGRCTDGPCAEKARRERR